MKARGRSGGRAGDTEVTLRAIFVHPERANVPILAPCLPEARIARADGMWVRDRGGHAVLTLVAPIPGERPQLATGLILQVPAALLPALDLMWRGDGIMQGNTWASVSLRREPVTAWFIEDLRHARMYGYRVPGVSQGG